MAGVIFEIDPVSEDAANANLVIVDNSTYSLLEYNDDPNPWDVMTASSADTEGEFVVQNRPTNRTVSIKLRVTGVSASALETTLYGLQQKIGKLAREGGTLKKTTPTGDTVVFDVMSNTYAPGGNQFRYIKNQRAEVQLTFLCKPYARGPAVTLSDHVETTLPCLIFTETSLAGDVPGWARLIIDEDQGVNQSWLVWGVQSRYYDSAATAALFYQAESLTPLAGAATAAGGGSGTGNTTVRTAQLTTIYQTVLSTQASGGGAHLSHVGSFRVFARVQRAAIHISTLSVALEWGVGDFRTFTRNVPVDIGWDRRSDWVFADLGVVSIPKVAQGTQRWEGRVIAKDDGAGSLGEVLDLDYLLLVPIDEGSGEALAVVRTDTPSTFLGLDQFNQTAGNLTGKTAGVGGTWAGAGGTDLTVETTGHTAQNATSSSARVVTLATSYTDIITQVDVKFSDRPALGITEGGAVARYVDTANFVRATINMGGNLNEFRLHAYIAGTGDGPIVNIPNLTTNIWYSIRVRVDANGQAWAWFWEAGGNPGEPIASLRFTSLATGGTLATGKPGFFDSGPVSAVTRNYDNFQAFAPVKDAAIFASQSLELRSDQVIREDSAGTIWQKPSRYEGDYLLVPPAGKEARSARFVVKTTRFDPATTSGDAIDDLSARLTYTPRYLVVPS